METTHNRRRLTTILAADVVSYSKLMAEDEEATLRTLRSHREVIDRLIERHDGRIFNTGGDSVLAEFGSAVEAVRCAISMQDELRVRNAELVPDRRLLLRIGINVGDVIVEGADLLGDGVNIAARLEGLAQAGGICISGSTFEQVKNKLSVGFQDLGPQQVKNIPEPVAAFSITSAPVVVAATGATAAAPAARRGWRLPVAAVVLLGLGVATAVVATRYFAPGGPRPLSAFADNLTTDEMTAGDITALMAGATITGLRAIDKQPFKIFLGNDMTLSYSFDGTGDQSGTTQQETGRWWAEDARFCMQVAKFAKGQPACPRIVKTGQTLAAVRPNGTALPWTVIKNEAVK